MRLGPRRPYRWIGSGGSRGRAGGGGAAASVVEGVWTRVDVAAAIAWLSGRFRLPSGLSVGYSSAVQADRSGL